MGVFSSRYLVAAAALSSNVDSFASTSRAAVDFLFRYFRDRAEQQQPGNPRSAVRSGRSANKSSNRTARGRENSPGGFSLEPWSTEVAGEALEAALDPPKPAVSSSAPVSFADEREDAGRARFDGGKTRPSLELSDEPVWFFAAPDEEDDEDAAAEEERAGGVAGAGVKRGGEMSIALRFPFATLDNCFEGEAEGEGVVEKGR